VSGGLGPTGATGPAGLTGATGATGPAGSGNNALCATAGTSTAYTCASPTPSVTTLGGLIVTVVPHVANGSSSTLNVASLGSKNLIMVDCSTAVPAGALLANKSYLFSYNGTAFCQDAPMIFTCQPGLGDGLNAITGGTYLQSECFNQFGATYTITSITCYTDNNGTSTLNVTNGAGTGLLTGAITCTNTIPGASGTQSGTTTIANGDGAKFTFVADGTSKQTTWTITGAR